jgi:DNA-binding CsgD family transcriptional regulator
MRGMPRAQIARQLGIGERSVYGIIAGGDGL